MIEGTSGVERFLNSARSVQVFNPLRSIIRNRRGGLGVSLVLFEISRALGFTCKGKGDETKEGDEYLMTFERSKKEQRQRKMGKLFGITEKIESTIADVPLDEDDAKLSIMNIVERQEI